MNWEKIAKERGEDVVSLKGKNDRLIDLLDCAVKIIENARGGEWKNENPVWEKAAKKWRDDYFNLMKEAGNEF